MGEHEERRARESLEHDSDQSLRDELASVLARIVADPELAPTVARRAGVPQQHLPAFKTATVFWSAVVEHTANGMASTERLVAAALGCFPHDKELLALEPRVRGPSASKRALPDKLTRNEFASLLDRGSPWGMLVTECKDPDGTSMVMWVEGGSDQKLDLFIQRIVGRLRDFVDIDVLPVGRALRHGPVAEDWASSMIAAVQGSRSRVLSEALAFAARSKDVMFVLDDAGHPIPDDLDELHTAELVRFVRELFAPAVARAAPRHRVRLFVAIETKSAGPSKLAAALDAAVEGLALGKWTHDPIKTPGLTDVCQSIDRLLRPTAPLSPAERSEVGAELVRSTASADHDLRQLAQRLYPLYERFHATRTRSNADGG